MVRLVVTDMDGTLVNSKDELPVDLRKRMKQLKELGVRFAIASGRQYWNLEKRFHDMLDDMIIIAENGAVIYDQGKCIYSDEIPYDDVATFVHTLRNDTSNITVLCGLKSAYIETRDNEFYQHLRKFYERVELVDDLLEAAKIDGICKIAIYNKESSEKNIYPIVKQFEDQFLLAVSGNFWLDIMRRGVDKGTGIQKIQSLYGITREECMAFGDFLNDYEMMQVCEHSVAMANAHPKLKEICKHETESNNEDGVMKELKRYFHLED